MLASSSKIEIIYFTEFPAILSDLYQFESHLNMLLKCWMNKKNSFKNTFVEKIFRFLYKSFVSIIKILGNKQKSTQQLIQTN